MSTIEECHAAKLLVIIGGNLRRTQLAQRMLLAGPEVVEKMKSELPGMMTDEFFPGSVRPVQQAAILFRHFVAGDDFQPPLPHEMRPHGQGVWRLKTPDLRFDGWFPVRNVFVIGAFDSKAQAKMPGRNDEMVAEVVALRNRTQLNGGKYLESEDYRDLIQL